MNRDPIKQPQIEGITPRQPRRLIGDFTNPRGKSQYKLDSGKAVKQVDSTDSTSAKSPKKNTGPRISSPNDLLVNFDDIDDKQETAESKSWWSKFKPSSIKRGFSFKRLIKRFSLVAVVLVVGVVGFVGIKLFFATQSIIDRQGGGALALNQNVDPSELKGEGDGRVNILLIGIGGAKHTGGDLADTIIVASIDPFAKEVSMLSVPRDLWVPIPGEWTTKINAAHALGDDNGFNEPDYPKDGPGLLQKTIEQTLDIPIHYFIRVDFDGFKQAVDTVGGIDLDVPETICDYKIAWQFDFDCIYAGQQKLNSDQALYYARTRATARSDFDRGERDRLLLMALRDEVLKAGTYSNPLKISSLLDAAGSHVRTNLSISEMLRIYEIGKDIPASSIASTGLDDYVKTANINGASAVIPKAGDGNFKEIQDYVHSIFIDGFIKQEGAVVDVLNGSGEIGLASTKADELTTYGYKIGIIGNAPEETAYTILYDLTNGANPYTKRYLEQRFGVKAVSGDELPSTVVTDSDFVIILGSNAKR